MNIARANYVLSEITNTAGMLESECERLCLLIKEARENQYWKLYYRNEKAWAIAIFPRNYGYFRQLARLALYYADNPDLITKLGFGRATALIPVIKAEGGISEKWMSDASTDKYIVLAAKVRAHYPPMKHTRKFYDYELKAKLERLRSKLERHRKIILAIEMQIEKLECRLKELEAA